MFALPLPLVSFVAALREEGVLLRHDHRRSGDGEARRRGQGKHLRHGRHPGAPHGLAENHLPLGHRRAEGMYEYRSFLVCTRRVAAAESITSATVCLRRGFVVRTRLSGPGEEAWQMYVGVAFPQYFSRLLNVRQG